MARPPESPRMLPSQENLLLDYVRRLESHKKGRHVAHIRISTLKPFNRRENHLRAAANNFEPFIKEMAGQLFTLKNNDLFFIYKNEIHPAVETVVQQIRFMFSDDPLFDEGASKGKEEFVSWYNAERDYDKILKLAQKLAEYELQSQEEQDKHKSTRSNLKARQKMGDPLTPEILGRVVTALSRADLSNIVRRQFACAINNSMIPEQRFSELFISIKDLRETLLPGVNLLSSPWLFQYLTETLDLRMLSMLAKTDTLTISGDISFNVNISTLLGPEFLKFDDNITAARRGAMIIELQKQDIFADIGAFLFARDFIQEKGYRVCLDGLSHKTLSMVDRERLGVDYVKLVWNPEMADQSVNARHEVIAEINNIGKNRIILCRVDGREAVDFGLSLGIGIFQGRFVENLIVEDNRRRELLRLKRRVERNEQEEEEEEY